MPCILIPNVDSVSFIIVMQQLQVQKLISGQAQMVKIWPIIVRFGAGSS